MKNSEWEATVYLMQSKYGKGSEPCINSAKRVTGCSVGWVGSSGAHFYDNCTKTYESTSGICASTTGTIYGAYDMSGGKKERVMENFNNNIMSL